MAAPGGRRETEPTAPPRPWAEAAAHYRIVVVADLDLIPQWMEVGRRRAFAARLGDNLGESIPIRSESD